MPLVNAAKHVMLDALGAVAVFASLHTAYPGSGGSNEVSGGSPAYARKAITWNAASSGNMDNNADPVFDYPASTTVPWLGYWSASSAGTYYGCSALGGGNLMPFTAEDSTDFLTVDNHGLTDTTQVVVYDAGAGAVLPTGLTEGTVYFVRDATTDTFKLAATSGGVAIDLTADGAGFVQTIVPVVSGATQATFTITDADISLALVGV